MRVLNIEKMTFESYSILELFVPLVFNFQSAFELNGIDNYEKR